MKNRLSGSLQVEKILREAPDVNRIYMPVRSSPTQSVQERFWGKVRCLLCSSHAESRVLRGCSSICFESLPDVLRRLRASPTPQFLQRAFFNQLRQIHGAGFEGFIREKLVPVPGNVDEERLGLSDEDYNRIQDEVRFDVEGQEVCLPWLRVDRRKPLQKGAAIPGAA